jgi:hypothetical protein
LRLAAATVRDPGVLRELRWTAMVDSEFEAWPARDVSPDSRSQVKI